jgi:carboxymethylenebutenolidase
MTYRALSAQEITFAGHAGDTCEGYTAVPRGDAATAGIVVIHHMPGWDEWSVETTRRLAHHGYNAICPNLYSRNGPGSPDDVAARVRAAGGVPDAQVMGDVAGAIAWLRTQPGSNGRVGVIGFCSGGRHTFLAACTVPGIDAAVDCWGGNVVVDDKSQLTPMRPVAPIDYTAKLACPLLGIFGNDDKNPTPAAVDRLEEELKRFGKAYEFHRYDGAGHGFFAYTREGYRHQQATDGWDKVWTFLKRHLRSKG